MKKLVWACAFVGLLGAQACSSSSDGISVDNQPVNDAATTVDTGSATPDTGSATEEASVTCSVATDTNIPACDTCLATNCCGKLETCVNDSEAGTADDAGASDCQQLLGCIVQSVNSDSGTGTEAALQDCQAGHSQTAVTEANDFLQCWQSNCNSDCP
jgi:hypothetical protein